MKRARTIFLSAAMLAVGGVCAGHGTDVADGTGVADDARCANDRTLLLRIAAGEFRVRLEDTAAARALCAMLPLGLTLHEHAGNEKYADLPQRLPVEAERPRSIRKGDVMLWGDDVLVIFYRTFETRYSYTRIGRIDDPSGLAEALGAGSVRVRLEPDGAATKR